MTQPLGNCPGCGGNEPFEQIHSALYAGDVCPDSGGECPEWACSACGTGVFMGTVITGTSAAAAGEGAAPGRRSLRAA
jgi:hypothetical protein